MEQIGSQLSKYNIKYERFAAVQGALIKNSPMLTEYCNSFCTDGQKGCAISHKTLWNRAVQEEYRSILVLEDDAILADDFDTKLKDAWYQVPNDYDFVFLGCRFFCNTTEALPITVTKIMNKSPEEIDEKVSKVHGTIGTHGYILTFHTAQVLETVPINWHMDMEITNYIKDYNLNAYSIKPVLVDVIDEAGGSNLSDTYPPLLNSLFNFRIFEQTTLAWMLNETSFKIASFNISTLMILLFILMLLLPTFLYKYVFLWLSIELLVSKDIHNTVKYIALLSIPMVARYHFKSHKKPVVPQRKR
jgi:glycosyl transferase family 25